MNDTYTFGGWLKQRRKRLRLTQRELAKEVGYAEVTLRKVEADELRPSLAMAQRLAGALQIPAAEHAQFLRFARDEAGAAQTIDPNAQIRLSQHLAPDYPPRLALVTAATRIDWSEAPDVSKFQGREQEVRQLRQWLAADQCHMVAVLGMGGIGKTALATFVAADVQAQFTAVIWRSLRNAPPLAELLRQWIQVLLPHAERELPREVDQLVDLLMAYLRGQRCLLVVDNFETVLAGERPGHYLPGYEGYGWLLKQIGEGRHQSCLLLTSREKPRELIPLEGQRAPVRTLAVAGLPLSDGRALLQDHGLRGSEADWAALHARYSGNPLALQIISETIHELFAGEIGRFLRQDTFLFGGITDLLEHQRARLSPLEQDILFWLAVAREPVTPEELVAELLPPPTQAAVLAALHALRHRFLVEQTETGFTLQNVVLEFFTATLIDQVCAEICIGSTDLLQRYALLKASAKSYVRERQRSLILGPVAQRTLQQLDPPALKDQFNNIMAQLRHSQRRRAGYAGGNIFNLMVQAGIDVCGQDFSRLALWHADLRHVTAPDVSFRQSDLSQSAFTDTFAGVFSLAFSPDGQRVAAATMTGEIRLWQVMDGKPLATWVAHRGWVRSVCFSPDGNILASTGGDQTVRLWHANDGTLLATLQGHTNFVNSAYFSPDGGLLASGSSDQTIRLWDSHSGDCLCLLQGHTNFVNSVCFSPDGSVLASGSSDETIRLWDSHTGACLRLLSGHTNFVNSVSFGSGGGVLASGSEDGTVRLWSTHTGACLQLLAGHTGPVTSVCFSPDGSVLASASIDQAVRLWDSHTSECLRLLQGHTAWIWSVCFSSAGSVLASGGYDQTVRLWDSNTGACLHLLRGHTVWVNSICFSHDGRVLASGSNDETIRLWDTLTGACLRLIHGHTNFVNSVCFSPDGNMLASASNDETIRLWDSYTGECLYLIHGHRGWVNAVCFSPDNAVLASGSNDATVRLWHAHTGKSLLQLEGHSSWISSVCFGPGTDVLASSSDDATVRLWDINTGQCLRLLLGHTSLVSSVCFSPDGYLLASGSKDQTVRLWDTGTGTCLLVLHGHAAWVNCVCFSPDGSVLASGGDDQVIRLWDSHTGACLYELHGHTNSVSSVRFSTDGAALASGSNDETIRLWDVNAGSCLQVLRADRPYERMNITGATGLTSTQIAALKRLGAVNDTDPPTALLQQTLSAPSESGNPDR